MRLHTIVRACGLALCTLLAACFTTKEELWSTLGGTDIGMEGSVICRKTEPFSGGVVVPVDEPDLRPYTVRARQAHTGTVYDVTRDWPNWPKEKAGRRGTFSFHKIKRNVYVAIADTLIEVHIVRVETSTVFFYRFPGPSLELKELAKKHGIKLEGDRLEGDFDGQRAFIVALAQAVADSPDERSLPLPGYIWTRCDKVS